jgi:hypothetical protein
VTETAEPKTYEPDDPANPNNLVMRGADGDPLPHPSGRPITERESYERVVEGLKTAADACQHIAKQETVQVSTWIDMGAMLEKMRVEAVKLAGHDAEMKQEETRAARGDPYSWGKTRERLLDGMRQATGGMRQLATCFGGNSSWLLMAQQLARYEKNLRALLSPQAIHKTGNFLEVGPALFTPEDVQRFATQAKLAVPEGAHCLELAGGLSRSIHASHRSGFTPAAGRYRRRSDRSRFSNLKSDSRHKGSARWRSSISTLWPGASLPMGRCARLGTKPHDVAAPNDRRTFGGACDSVIFGVEREGRQIMAADPKEISAPSPGSVEDELARFDELPARSSAAANPPFRDVEPLDNRIPYVRARQNQSAQ